MDRTPLPIDALHARYRASRALYARAREIIPGAHNLSGRPLVDPDTTPMYFERARGCRVWDVDGQEYIDYLMAFGPFLLENSPRRSTGRATPRSWRAPTACSRATSA